MRATLGVFSTCRRSGIGTVRTMSGVQLVDLGYGVASEYKQRSTKSLLPPHLRIGLTGGQLISLIAIIIISVVGTSIRYGRLYTLIKGIRAQH